MKVAPTAIEQKEAGRTPWGEASPGQLALNAIRRRCFGCADADQSEAGREGFREGVRSMERGFERKDLPRPTNESGREIFKSLRPGQLVDDSTIETFLTDKGK